MLDFGIVVTPLNNSEILETPLYYEEMRIFHHPDHPFSEQSIINVDTIDQGDLWLLGRWSLFQAPGCQLLRGQQI